MNAPIHTPEFIEAERKLFEAWVSPRREFAAPLAISAVKGPTSKFSDGVYSIPQVQTSWKAWLAARSLTADSHTALVGTLTEAREFVQLNLDELLESCCILDKVTLKPDRLTLDPMDKLVVDDVDAVLAKIDAALALANGGGE